MLIKSRFQNVRNYFEEIIVDVVEQIDTKQDELVHFLSITENEFFGYEYKALSFEEHVESKDRRTFDCRTLSFVFESIIREHSNRYDVELLKDKEEPYRHPKFKIYDTEYKYSFYVDFKFNEYYTNLVSRIREYTPEKYVDDERYNLLNSFDQRLNFWIEKSRLIKG